MFSGCCIVSSSKVEFFVNSFFVDLFVSVQYLRYYGCIIIWNIVFQCLGIIYYGYFGNGDVVFNGNGFFLEFVVCCVDYIVMLVFEC